MDLTHVGAGVQGAAQNRAIDGDEVALHVLPPAQWHHMRGGALPSGDLLAVPVSDPPLRQQRSPSHSGYCLPAHPSLTIGRQCTRPEHAAVSMTSQQPGHRLLLQWLCASETIHEPAMKLVRCLMVAMVVALQHAGAA